MTQEGKVKSEWKVGKESEPKQSDLFLSMTIPCRLSDSHFCNYVFLLGREVLDRCALNWLTFPFLAFHFNPSHAQAHTLVTQCIYFLLASYGFSSMLPEFPLLGWAEILVCGGNLQLHFQQSTTETRMGPKSHVLISESRLRAVE